MEIMRARISKMWLKSGGDSQFSNALSSQGCAQGQPLQPDFQRSIPSMVFLKSTTAASFSGLSVQASVFRSGACQNQGKDNPNESTTINFEFVEEFKARLSVRHGKKGQGETDVADESLPK
jgi:hypothetical protein